MRGFAPRVKRGGDDCELLPAYVIAVVDFDLPGTTEAPGGYDGYLHRFTLKSERGELLSRALQVYFLELSKLPAVADATDVLDPLEQWAEAMRSTPALDGVPAWVTEEDLRKAFTVSELANLTPEERRKWERAFREDRDLRGQVLQQYIWGKQEGKEEGREEIAREMLADGMDPPRVAKLSKLSLERVRRLSRDL